MTNTTTHPNSASKHRQRHQRHMIAMITTLAFFLHSCSAHSQSHHHLPDVLTIPATIPSNATLWKRDQQVEYSAVVVSREWPTVTGDNVDTWYADESVPELQAISADDELKIHIPTEFIPESVSYWFYDEIDDNTRIPSGPPIIAKNCNQTIENCVEVLNSFDAIAVRLPLINDDGLLVVQIEWIAPPSNSTTPLIARVSWAISYQSQAQTQT